MELLLGSKNKSQLWVKVKRTGEIYKITSVIFGYNDK